MEVCTIVVTDLAGVVLDKCITRAEVEDNDGTLNTTQMMYNFEFIDDFDEPKLGRLGNFLLNKVQAIRNKSKSQGIDIPLVVINDQSGNEPHTSTDNLQSEIGNEMSASPVSPSHRLSPVSSNKRPSAVSLSKRFSAVSSTNEFPVPSAANWGPKVYDKDNHTMTLMVRVRKHVAYTCMCVQCM